MIGSDHEFTKARGHVKDGPEKGCLALKELSQLSQFEAHLRDLRVHNSEKPSSQAAAFDTKSGGKPGGSVTDATNIRRSWTAEALARTSAHLPQRVVGRFAGAPHLPPGFLG